ncbi:MAG: putative toxin-antitoxin system toxin component, PIN family [Candidatus Bathyarchaeia archaeon]
MPSSRKRRPRLVLDSNVWISAFLFGGKPAAIIKLAQEGRVRILVSTDLILEIARVLRYGKLRKILEQSKRSTETVVAQILAVTEFVGTKSLRSWITQDPADDIILNCAVENSADYIITGDQHILQLKRVDGVKIFTPNEFLQHLQTNK